MIIKERTNSLMALLIKKLAFITAMAALSIVGTIYSYVYLVKDLTDQREAIDSGAPLIVLKTMHSYLPGNTIIGVGIFLTSIALYAFLYNKSVYRKVMPVGNWIIFSGIVIMFIGGIGIKYYWHHSAKSSGYVKCGILDKISTTKMHTSIWSKDESYCNNSQAAKVISGISMEGLERANEYLLKNN